MLTWTRVWMILSLSKGIAGPNPLAKAAGRKSVVVRIIKAVVTGPRDGPTRRRLLHPGAELATGRCVALLMLSSI